MTKENFADEIMSDEELDQVAGGTIREFNQIIRTISSNTALINKFKDALEEIPSKNLTLENMAKPVAKILGEIGIDAAINLSSDANSYKDIKTGKTLSHDAILSRIKSFS